MHNPQGNRFQEARRIQDSFFATAERKTLLWLAKRTPATINSDHLTVLGLVAMAGAGASYWWSATHRAGLLLAILCLAANWLGDSLDGTLARFRNCPRPRYGFYVDHIVDAFSAFFLLSGLGASGYMSNLIAGGLLIAYLMISIEVYLASYTLADFRISYFKLGPTELRALLCIGNAAVFWKPVAHIAGRAYHLFDVGGFIGICGMLAILLISTARNTLRLYRQEPLVVGEGHRPRPDNGRRVPGEEAAAQPASKHCAAGILFSDYWAQTRRPSMLTTPSRQRRNSSRSVQRQSPLRAWQRAWRRSP